MPKLTALDEKARNIRKELAETQRTKSQLKAKIGFIQNEFPDNSAYCVRPAFYRTVFEFSFNDNENTRAVKILKRAIRQYFDAIRNVVGWDYAKKSEAVPPSEKLQNVLRAEINGLNAKLKETHRHENYFLSSLFEKCSPVLGEEYETVFKKETERTYALFRSEENRFSAELKRLELTETRLKQNLDALNEERAKLSSEAKQEQLKKNNAEAATKIREALMREEAEKGKKTKEVQEALENLSKSAYPDIRDAAKKLMDGMGGGHLDQAAEEVASLRTTQIARNDLEKKLDSELVKLMPACKKAAECFKKWGAANELGGEVKKLKDAIGARPYSDSLLERVSKLQDEADAWISHLDMLNQLKKNDRKADLEKLRPIIKRIIEKRDSGGLERLVRLLKWTIKYKERIGADKLPGLIEQIGRGDCSRAIEEVNRHKDKNETERDRRIEDLKTELGFENLSDLSIINRVGQLRHSIGDGGIATLRTTGELHYPPQHHDHSLLGMRPSLKMLLFETHRIMKPDKLDVKFEEKDKIRLGKILALYERIRRRNEALA